MFFFYWKVKLFICRLQILLFHSMASVPYKNLWHWRPNGLAPKMTVHVMYLLLSTLYGNYMMFTLSLHHVLTATLLQETEMFKCFGHYIKLRELLPEFKIKFSFWTMLFLLYKSGFWLWGLSDHSCSIHSVQIQKTKFIIKPTSRYTQCFVR